MIDPIYQPPKTDSNYKEPSFQHDGWSGRKLCILTLLPSVLWVLSGVFVIVPMFIFVPILALIIAIATAGNFSATQQTSAVGSAGLTLVWIAAHAALLFLATSGCAIIYGKGGAILYIC